jgi:hypothetical protein
VPRGARPGQPWDIVPSTPSACTDAPYDARVISDALGLPVEQSRGARMGNTQICSLFGDDVRVDLVTEALSSPEVARRRCQKQVVGDQAIPLSPEVEGWFGHFGAASTRGSQCTQVMVSVHAVMDPDASLRIAKAIWGD